MAGRKNQSSVEKHDVVGYFLPDLSGSVQDDLDEDADPEDNDYLDLDMEEMEYGGGMPGTNCLVDKTVQFQVFNQTHPLTVTGRFIMDMFDPWWKVTVQVRRNRNDRKFMVKGTFAAYELRDDNGVHRDHILELFLSKCCKGDVTQFKDEFLNYVRNNEINLNFTNILEYLEEFRKENPAVAEQLLMLVKASGVLQAANVKIFFKFIPQLLPRRFDYLCAKKQRQGNPVSVETRSAIDLALEEEPWILGFSTIMFNHFKVVGCEASLDALKNCGLFDKMPSKYKDALSIYHVLKADCRQFGHTYIVESGGKSVESGLAYAGLTISSFKDAYEFLTSNGIVKRETKNRQKRVYLYRLWKSEVSITETVDKLIQEPPWSFTIDFDSSPVFASLKGDPDQMRAARMMSENAVTVLSGKGGCGKTHVVGAVFKYAEKLIMEENLKKFETDFPEDDDDISLSQAAAECEKNYNLSQQNKDNVTSGPSIPSNQQPESSQPKKIPDSPCCILLTAPTGKASKVLQKRAHLPGYTLHSINASFSNWNMQPKECRDPWNFSKVRALIVDECSLVSVQLISTTLNIMQEHADLRKVIFIGDVKQLPSIDPGNFLYDMYNSLDKLGYSVTLRKNHRSGVDLIVKNATLISNRQWPEFNEEQNFHLIEVEGDQVIDIETAVNELLRNKDSPLQNHEMSQFVAFRRKDCSSINDLCSRHYNKHTTLDGKKRLQFRVGDKVCCTRNHIVVDHSEHPKEKKDDIDFSNTHADGIASTSNMSNISNNGKGPSETAENSKQAKEKEKQDKKIKLYNGEVFFIREDVELIDKDRHQRFLVLDDLERTIKVDFKEVMRECKLQHAWARTIHTYQGSESDVIVYVVGSSYRQTWQHVYTAVTRGKHNVFIITQCEELYNAIQNIPYKRYTSLKERMEELVNKILKEKPCFKVPLAGGDAYNQQRSTTSSNLTNTKPWMAAETEEESQEFEFSEEFDQVDNSRHSSESRGSTDNRAISYSSTKGKGKSSSKNQPHASTLNPGLRNQTVNGSGINFNGESILVSSHSEPKDMLNGSDSQDWAGLDDSDYDKLALIENEAILSLSQQGSANQANASTRNSVIRNIDFSGDKEKIISSQMATEENMSSDETDSQCTQTPSHYLSETDSLSTQTPSQYLLDDKKISTQESSQVVEYYDDMDSDYVMEFSDNEGVIVMKGEHDETIIVCDDDGTEDDMLSDDSESILTSATQPGYSNNSDSKSRPELNNVELTGDNMENSSQESQSLLCCNHNRLETEDDSEESQSILTHNLPSSSPSRKCQANTKYSPGKRGSPENSSSGLPYKRFNSQGSVSPLAKGLGKFRIKDDKKSCTQ